jgi:hypothetical protein
MVLTPTVKLAMRKPLGDRHSGAEIDLVQGADAEYLRYARESGRREPIGAGRKDSSLMASRRGTIV